MAQLFVKIFHPGKIPRDDFENDFKRSFPDGQIKLVKEDGIESRLIDVLIPPEQINQLILWWEEYLIFHGYKSHIL